MKNYYEILNVHLHADNDEIRKYYYKTLEKVYISNYENKEEIIKNIKEAYFFLMNNQLKKEHNKSLGSIIKSEQELIIDAIDDIREDEKELVNNIKKYSKHITLYTVFLATQIIVAIGAFNWDPENMYQIFAKDSVLILDSISIAGSAIIGVYKDLLNEVLNYQKVIYDKENLDNRKLELFVKLNESSNHVR